MFAKCLAGAFVFGVLAGALSLATNQAAAQEDSAKALPFGPAAQNGLRFAWVLDPVKDAYTVGELVKCRVVFRNDGKAPVEFRPYLGNPIGGNKTIDWIVWDVTGSSIKTRAIRYSGGGPILKFYKLGPGEMATLPTKGLVFGKEKYRDLISTGKLGTIVPAQAGDVLRLSWEITLPGTSDLKRARPGEWMGTLKSREITLRIAKVQNP